MITRYGKGRTKALLAALALIGMSSAALAQTHGTTVSPPRVNDNALQMQMQIQRNQIQSQTYRLQQRINREQDRQNNMQRPGRENVPVYHSTCTPTNGVSCN